MAWKHVCGKVHCLVNMVGEQRTRQTPASWWPTAQATREAKVCVTPAYYLILSFLCLGYKHLQSIQNHIWCGAELIITSFY